MTKDSLIEELVKALEGLLKHAGIADAAPEDVDWEDRQAERIARAALSRARAAQSEEWQPIETAPKDGTPILGTDEDGEQYVIEWWPKGARQDGFYECGDLLRAPTHWRPLPSPPSKQEGA